MITGMPSVLFKPISSGTGGPASAQTASLWPIDVKDNNGAVYQTVKTLQPATRRPGSGLPGNKNALRTLWTLELEKPLDLWNLWTARIAHINGLALLSAGTPWAACPPNSNICFHRWKFSEWERSPSTLGSDRRSEPRMFTGAYSYPFCLFMRVYFEVGTAAEGGDTINFAIRGFKFVCSLASFLHKVVFVLLPVDLVVWRCIASPIILLLQGGRSLETWV